MPFPDHFSSHAADYARYRPGYPDSLFSFVGGLVSRRERAWDVATGNGQVATGLADTFGLVLASDASVRQLRRAVRRTNIRYAAARAEERFTGRGTFDLVTVGQALHWIDLPAFYDVVRQVTRPGGIIAVWSYDLPRTDPAIDVLTDRLHGEVLAGFWAPQRRIVDERYRTIPFPFEELEVPTFTMRADWDLDRFVGYLGTWSAVRRYRRARDIDPVSLIRDRLHGAWGPADTIRRLTWPLSVRVGQVGGVG